MSRTALTGVGGLPGRIWIAIRGSLARRDGRTIFGLGTVLYLLVYLWGIGQLTVGGRPPLGTVDVVIADDPLGMMTRQIAPYQWEPIAILHLAPYGLGPIDLLIAPMNLLLGLALAVLVAVNLAVAWVAWRGPAACRIGPGAGAVAGVPALLSGFACCGPTILFVLGIQASAGLLAAMQWFVPIAVVLLIGTLVWVGRFVDPATA